MCYFRTSAILLVACCPVASAAGDKADELGFNLFTDLAPLLALFGEQFARQFMSESLLWLDHVIFAMVPLGILTAVVGAIRVSGPSWARAFIGRARESRASAEIQLMSSTSEDVCEVYNGKAIVRSTGQPQITQLLLYPGVYRSSDRTCGIHTLESAYNHKPPLLEMRDFGVKVQDKASTISTFASDKDPQDQGKHGTKHRLRYRKSTVSSKSDIENNNSSSSSFITVRSVFPTELKYYAPNLQLNLPDTILDYTKSVQELWYAAVTAVFVQAAVIVIGAVTSYNSAIRRKVGGEVRKYGYPMFASGTICLNVGMMLCSWVIERSTREYSWRPSQNISPSASSPSGRGDVTKDADHTAGPLTLMDDAGIHLFWLQRKHTVSDQAVGSYLILGGRKKEIITSSPFEHVQPENETMNKTYKSTIISDRYEFATICGAILGVAGFILQFEGLRGLGWPTAVAQVTSIVLLALLRAYLRRRLGGRPSTFSATEDHELDWLALRLVYEDNPLKPTSPINSVGRSLKAFKWQVVTASNNEDEYLLASEGQMLGGDEMTSVEDTFENFNVNETGTNRQTGFFPRDSQTVLRVRQRLGELVRCPSIASREAVALSQAYSIVLNEVYPISKGDFRTFEWYMDARMTTHDPRHQDLELSKSESRVDRVTLQAHGDHELGWRVHSPDIDAILSLWMASYLDESTNASLKDEQTSLDWLLDKESGVLRYRMILGVNPRPSNQSQSALSDPEYAGNEPNIAHAEEKGEYELESKVPDTNESAPTGDGEPDGFDIEASGIEILTRDLGLWTDDPRIAELASSNSNILGGEIEVVPSSLENSASKESVITSGFHGIQGIVDSGSAVWIEANAPLPTILSQHMFSAFIWAVSSHIPADTFIQTTLEEVQRSRASNPNDVVEFPRLRSARMMKIAHDIESTGISTAEDILLLMIPPLSYQRLLPNEAMLEPLLEAAKRSETNRDWRGAAHFYEALLTLHLNPLSHDRLSIEIIVEVLEFLFITYEALDDRKGTRTSIEARLNSSAQSLRTSVQSIISILSKGSLCLTVIKDLEWFYVQQRRYHHLEKIFPKLKETTREPANPAAGSTVLHAMRKQIGLPEWYYESWRLEVPQQWSPFKRDRDRIYNTSDVFGWTPLHYIAAGNVAGADDIDVVDELCDLIQYWPSHHELRDKSGKTPLHYAAAHVPLLLERLISKRIVAKSAFSDQARDGSTPIHCAARNGKLESIRILKQYTPRSLSVQDNFGRSIFHIAAINNNIEILDQFIPGPKMLPASADELSGRTALHLALAHGSDRAALKLISQTSQVEVLDQTDSEGTSPLTMMLDEGRPRALEMLLAEYPEVVWRDDESLQTSDSNHGASNCFTALLHAALDAEHHAATKVGFRTIISRSWPDILLLRAFESFLGKGNFAFLPRALQVLGQVAHKPIIKRQDQQETEKTRDPMEYSRSTNENTETNNRSIIKKVQIHAAIHFGAEFLRWVMLNERDDLIGLLSDLQDVSGQAQDTKSIDWYATDAHGNSALLNLVKAQSAENPHNAEKRHKLMSFLLHSWSSDLKEARLNEHHGDQKSTPIIYAARHGLVSLVDSLAEAGAATRAVDKSGFSAFYYALWGLNQAMADTLVRYDPDIVNARLGVEGSTCTPLVQAVKSEQYEVLGILLKYGQVDPHIRDSDGATALGWCKTNGNIDIEKQLMARFPGLDVGDNEPGVSSPQRRPQQPLDSQQHSLPEPRGSQKSPHRKDDSKHDLLNIVRLLTATYNLYAAVKTAPAEICSMREHVHDLSIVLEATKTNIIANPRSFLYQSTDIARVRTHALRLRLTQCDDNVQRLWSLERRYRAYTSVHMWDRFKWSSGGKWEIAQCKASFVLLIILLDIFLSKEGLTVLWTLESSLEIVTKKFNILAALPFRSPPLTRSLEKRKPANSGLRVGRVLILALVIGKFRRILRRYREKKQNTEAKLGVVDESGKPKREAINQEEIDDARRLTLGRTSAAISPSPPQPLRRTNSIRNLIGLIDSVGRIDRRATGQSRPVDCLECWQVGVGRLPVGSKTTPRFFPYRRGQIQLKKIAETFKEASSYERPTLSDKDSRVQLLLKRKNSAKNQEGVSRWYFAAGRSIKRSPGATGIGTVEKAIIIIQRRQHR